MRSKSTWLQGMNKEWQAVPGYALFSERSVKSFPDDIHLTPSQNYGVLPQKVYMEITGNRVVMNITGGDNMKHVEANDFIIHLRSFQGGIEHSGYSGKVSNAYCVLKPNSSVLPGYFKWVLKSPGFIQELRSTTDQLRDGQSIKFEQFKSITFPLPPLEDQIRLARELDKANNALVESMSVIKELRIRAKELRTASINDMLGFSVISKFEELTTFAKNQKWKMIPLGRLGARISQDGYPDLEPLSIYLNLGVIPRNSREDNKNQLGSDLSKYQKVQMGDLVFNKLRTWQGGFGIAQQIGIVSPAYYVFRFDVEKVMPEYVDLLLKSPLYLAEITRVTKWMPPSQFDTSWDDLKNIQIVLPDLSEQRRFVEAYANNPSFLKLDEMLNCLSKRIDLLRDSFLTELILDKQDSARSSC